MTAQIANDIVVAVFALIIGGLAMLMSGYSRGLARDLKRARAERGERSRDLRGIFAQAEKRAEEGRRLVGTMPRSWRLLMAALFGLIVVLVLVVTFSPIEMSWIVFVVALVVGYLAAARVFASARAGRIRTDRDSDLDIFRGRQGK